MHQRNIKKSEYTFSVGFTGGIGSGKSTAVNFFREYGAGIIDCDAIARDLVYKDKAAYKSIVAHFSESILNAEKQIDRTQLRHLIFNNAHEKEWLESLLHPLIRQEIQTQLATLASPYVIVDIPLLKDTADFPYLDRILVIDCPEKIQIKRVSQRDNLPEEIVKKMIQSQITREQRNALADDYIMNNNDLNDLRVAVLRLHHQYLKYAALKLTDGHKAHPY